MKGILVRPTMRNGILSLILLSSPILCSVRAAPVPQAETKPTSPPNRPAQAQVMLAPSQVTAAQVPQKEPMPTDTRNPDSILRVGHRGSVQALAFSPDGRWLASGGYDKVSIVWNLASGREEFRLGGQKDTVTPPQQGLEKEAISSLVFNPDGTRLVSMNISGVIRVWNLQTRKMLFAFNPHRVHYYGEAVAYSADGKSLIIGVEKRAKEGTATAIGFYDAENGKSLRTIPTQWNFRSAVVQTNDGRLIFRPDGDEVAMLHGDSNAIDFVSAASGQVTKSLPGGGYGLGTAAYSADGKLLAAGTYAYGMIKVWDLGSMRAQATLHGQSPVQTVTFSPDGKLLATTSGELRIWDLATSKEIQTLTDAPVSRAVFSADGKWLASNPGGQFPGYAMKIWNANTWQEEASVTQEKGFPAFWLAFSEAKTAPRKIGNVRSWPFVSEGASRTAWGSYSAMAISPDGKWLAQPAVPTGAVEIWDATSGDKLRVIPAHKLAVTKLSFSRDGQWLISVGQDNNPMMVQGQPGVMLAYPRVSVWNTATWKLEFSITFPTTAGTDAEISADGKFLAVSKGSVTQLFDLEQKKPVAAFASPDGRSGYVAISPDGTLLVQGALEGVRLWKLATSLAAPN